MHNTLNVDIFDIVYTYFLKMLNTSSLDIQVAKLLASY